MRENNFTAIIPARFASTRFPGKPLAILANKPIIQHVYEAACKTNLFNDVIVATDDCKIHDAVLNFGGKVVMTSSNHKTGSDRIAEVCKNIETDVIVNIQGDEPFISFEPLKALIDSFNHSEIQVASLMHALEDENEIINPNNVKVVTDSNHFALYFSRSPIPFNRDKDVEVTYYKHIGVYAYRKSTLLNFVNMNKSRLEDIEKLEQLRLLENGIRIKMLTTEYKGIGIDTPEDLKRAEHMINSK